MVSCCGPEHLSPTDVEEWLHEGARLLGDLRLPGMHPNLVAADEAWTVTLGGQQS
jgi:hypothetical protein